MARKELFSELVSLYRVALTLSRSTGSLKMNPKSGLIRKTDPNMLVIMFSALILYRVQVLVLQSKH